MLDGIAKSRTRKLCRITFQKVGEGIPISFAHLAEHPAYGFMHQIMFMRHQPFGQRQRIGKIRTADKSPSTDNRNPLFPKIIAGSQFIQDGTVPVHQIFADNIPAGQIHQIPIIAAAGILQIETIHLFPFSFRCLLILKTVDQNQQGAKTGLMPGTIQQALQFIERHRFVSFRYTASLRNDNP